MYFKDIIGQEEAKQKIIREAQTGKIAHAQLFCGPEGIGKLPLAIAYARYLSCTNRNEHDACGTCPNCIKYNKLAHPDLHFVFPVVKKKSKDTVSDDYIAEWRELVNTNPYFNLNIWLDRMGAENQQAQIFVKESDEIIRKLSLKLLKLLEEPPAQTIFLLVSENPDMLLTTIQSRTQRFNLYGIEEEKIASILCQQYGLQETDAIDIAHQSEGNFIKSLETIHLSDEKKQFFELFVSLMRLSYQRKIREMRQWSEIMSSMGRERQKHFLTYCQRMIRENFMYNFQEPSLTYLNQEEQNFSSRFAPFVNERNVMGIMDELSEAQRHIEQNVNARMVFFDFSLKMIVLLVQK